MHSTPQAYTKTPNPSPIDPRKKAQDLMTTAENADHHETPAPQPCCGGACGGFDDLSVESIKLGTITLDVISVPNDAGSVAVQIVDQLEAFGMLDAGPNVKKAPRPLGEAGQQTYLTVPLPNLPEGVTVTPLAFRIKRGDAMVNIGYTESFLDKIGWCINGFRHEAQDNPENPPPFWKDLRNAVFDNPTDAIDAAVKWLDACDAWFEATQVAISAMKVRIGTIPSA